MSIRYNMEALNPAYEVSPCGIHSFQCIHFDMPGQCGNGPSHQRFLMATWGLSEGGVARDRGSLLEQAVARRALLTG